MPVCPNQLCTVVPLFSLTLFFAKAWIGLELLQIGFFPLFLLLHKFHQQRWSFFARKKGLKMQNQLLLL
jgi:hypothetical protein